MAITEKYVSALASGGSGTIGDPWDLQTAYSSAVAGNRLNVKNDGVYTINSTITPTNVGSETSPIFIRGYNSTIGDGWGFRTNGGKLDTSNMPEIKCNVSSGTMINGSSKGRWVYESIKFTRNSGKAEEALRTTYGIIINCSFEDINAITNLYCHTLNCDFYLSSTSASTPAINIDSSRNTLYECRISNSNGDGITSDGVHVAISNCLIHDCSGRGIYFSSPNQLYYTNVNNCTIANCVGAAIEFAIDSQDHRPLVAEYNMLTGCAYPFRNLDTIRAQTVISHRNRIRCTNGNQNLNDDWYDASQDITIDSGGGDSQDYIDAANGDYRLRSNSPAVNQGSFDWNDIGAYQLPQRFIPKALSKHQILGNYYAKLADHPSSLSQQISIGITNTKLTD